jgi:hypothetical protein
MSDNENKSNSANNVVSGLFDAIKDLVWWQKIIVYGSIILITVISYKFYDSEQTFFEFIKEGRAAFSEQHNPVIDKTKIKDVGKNLEKDGYDSVSIYEIKLGSSSRTLVYASVDGFETQDAIGDREPLYARASSKDQDTDMLRKYRYNELVFKLQNGDFACENLEPASKHGFFLEKNGIKYICAIGIPSGVTDYFVGSIVLGFKNDIDGQEDLARSSLYSAGQDILTKQ